MNNVCQYEGKTLGRLENLSLIDLSTRGWSHIMQNQVNKSYSFFEKKVDTCSMAGPMLLNGKADISLPIQYLKSTLWLLTKRVGYKNAEQDLRCPLQVACGTPHLLSGWLSATNYLSHRGLG